MNTAHVNLLAALISLVGSIAWTFLGDVLSGLIWFAAGLVWLTLGLLHLKRAEPDAHPVRTLARRVSRLLMFS